MSVLSKPVSSSDLSAVAVVQTCPDVYVAIYLYNATPHVRCYAQT